MGGLAKILDLMGDLVAEYERRVAELESEVHQLRAALADSHRSAAMDQPPTSQGGEP